MGNSIETFPEGTGKGVNIMSEVKETMEDFASELEASYKEYDARRNNAYQDQEGPDAEKWAELAQQMEDKTVLKVKVKEAVKGGLVAYVDDIQGFIPASQAADHRRHGEKETGSVCKSSPSGEEGSRARREACFR